MLKLVFAVSMISVAVFPLFVFADHDASENGVVHEINMGPLVGGRMLHAWISLAASVFIFSLALKFMVGGALARPIMLIGFGALADAIVGLFSSHVDHMEFMWLGSLLFSFSVVLGIIWMAKIFGVLKFKKGE